MAKQQKMVPPEDQPEMMIPRDEDPRDQIKAKLHAHKIKVHMTLHSGRAVEPGLVELTDEEYEHLKKSFGPSLHHIIG